MLLEEFLKPLGISQNAFAIRPDLSPSRELREVPLPCPSTTVSTSSFTAMPS